MALNNREPSLFAVAKLLETGLVNMNRIDVIWSQLMSHLLEVSRHPHQKMREWGAEAITTLVMAAVSPDHQSCLKNMRAKAEYLTPLVEMSSISHMDIRQKQLDTSLKMLQSLGEMISDGWPAILTIIGSINENQSESLIRLSFQSLQLIISDLLTNIPAIYIEMIVDVTSKFGSQSQELNVSLTAIGSIWNIADHLYQNQEKLKAVLSHQQNPNPESDTKRESDYEMSAFESLWITIFKRLSDLCTDGRPAIRKSASQTLFATLNSHGTILEADTWSCVLWQVLFPLLDRVKSSTQEASDEKIVDVPKSMGMTGIGVSGAGSSILLHHSRNTEYKQWAETQVLSLSGVCRIFSMRKDHLIESIGIEDFESCWNFLLGHIESAASSRNPEVSLSALKCFQDMICVTPGLFQSKRGEEKSNSRNELNLWVSVWRIWCKIGFESTQPPDLIDGQTVINSMATNIFIPSQAFLASLIQIFPFIFNQIKDQFSIQDFQQLSKILQQSVAVPVDVSTQAYVMSMMTTSGGPSPDCKSTNGSSCGIHHHQQYYHHNVPLTPLQDSVFVVIETVTSEIMSHITQGNSEKILNPSSPNHQNLEQLIPVLFSQLVTLMTYACVTPTYGKIIGVTYSKFSSPTEWMALNFVPFGERNMRLVVNLYQSLATLRCIIKSHVLHEIIRVS